MIVLCDIDSTLNNLVLMKESTHYKDLGEEVVLMTAKELLSCDEKFLKRIDKIIGSAIFTKSKAICQKLKEKFGDLIEIGGSGWDFEEINGELVQVRKTELSVEIEKSKPDYNLYSPEVIYSRIKGIMTKETRMKKARIITDAGMGFTSRGCVRNCAFCLVPKKEGCFRHVSEIGPLLNEKSNILILNDNNLTADPDCISKLHEIRDRKLIVDINQGCDVRLITPDIAVALAEVKHLRSIHYAWDLMGFENQVMGGINTLLEHMKAWRHMCFVLVGFNTTFEEDMYRVMKLKEMKIKPHVMVYNDKVDTRLKHFERWVNSNIYKACKWEEYLPWIKEQLKGEQIKFVI